MSNRIERAVAVRAVTRFLVALLWLAGFAFGVRADAFLSVLDDMPLMPGLTELTDQAADFETPEGRIVDAAAEGAVAEKSVLAFYDRTLPALGWKREGSGRFVRDRERLAITVSRVAQRGGAAETMVRFAVRPR